MTLYSRQKKAVLFNSRRHNKNYKKTGTAKSFGRPTFPAVGSRFLFLLDGAGLLLAGKFRQSLDPIARCNSRNLSSYVFNQNQEL